jgi:hypothetical protein
MDNQDAACSDTVLLFFGELRIPRPYIDPVGALIAGYRTPKNGKSCYSIAATNRYRLERNADGKI